MREPAKKVAQSHRHWNANAAATLLANTADPVGNRFDLIEFAGSGYEICLRHDLFDTAGERDEGEGFHYNVHAAVQIAVTHDGVFGIAGYEKHLQLGTAIACYISQLSPIYCYSACRHR